MATASDVKQAFSDPTSLLRHFYLQIAGGNQAPPNGAASVRTFKILVDANGPKVRGYTSGLSGLLGKTKSREFVRLTLMSGPAKPDHALAADEINAYYVPMAEHAGIGVSSHYHLPAAGGPDVMITSKLSGCRFGIGTDNQGGVLVTHVAPDKSVRDHGQRQNRVLQDVASGYGGGGNLQHSFGQGEAYDEYAAIIGRRNGTEWRFYCQPSRAGEKSSWIIDQTVSVEVT